MKQDEPEPAGRITTAGFVVNVVLPGTALALVIYGGAITLEILGAIHGDFFRGGAAGLGWYFASTAIWNIVMAAELRRVERRRRGKGLPFDAQWADASLRKAIVLKHRRIESLRARDRSE